MSVPKLIADAETDEKGLEAERAEARKQMKRELEQFIVDEGGEAELKAVLGCLLAGITKREEIAQRVGVEQKEVVRLKKKLRRRLAHFIEGARRNGGSRPRVKMG